MPALTDRFKIVELDESAQLNREELEKLLSILPIKFEIIEDNVPSQEACGNGREGLMEVYHDSGVIEIYPPSGNRLKNAWLFKMDFPIRPDNIMDDGLGLRCCFHPKVSSFGIEPRTQFGDEIEIDIHKYGNNR